MSDGEAKGRAGFNARHLRHGATGTESDRRSILKEAMRDLNDWDADFYANKNPNIVREETHLNKSLVNDGQGGFRHAKDVDEVVEYGNARIGTCDNDKGEDRVTDTGRKWRSDSFETSLFVVSLPRTLCTEIKDFYPVIDERGEPVVADGEPVMRSRWVARDIDEAREYFMRAAGFLGSNVLTGGTDAIHGIAPNFDEAYPHVQIMADTLGPGDDGALRCDASRMWGSHRDVRDASGRQESGKAKLSRYQRELREHMAQWYDVEQETAHRSKSSHSREEWARIKDREQIAKALRQSATRKRELIDAEGKRVQDREEEIDERAGKVRVRQAKLAKREAEVTARERQPPWRLRGSLRSVRVSLSARLTSRRVSRLTGARSLCRIVISGRSRRTFVFRPLLTPRSAWQRRQFWWCERLRGARIRPGRSRAGRSGMRRRLGSRRRVRSSWRTMLRCA